MTQAGQVLLEEARHLVSGVDAAVRRVQTVTGTEPGQLRSSAR